jgi:hypothetical protein
MANEKPEGLLEMNRPSDWFQIMTIRSLLSICIDGRQWCIRPRLGSLSRGRFSPGRLSFCSCSCIGHCISVCTSTCRSRVRSRTGESVSARRLRIRPCERPRTGTRWNRVRSRSSECRGIRWPRISPGVGSCRSVGWPRIGHSIGFGRRIRGPGICNGTRGSCVGRCPCRSGCPRRSACHRQRGRIGRLYGCRRGSKRRSEGFCICISVGLCGCIGRCPGIVHACTSGNELRNTEFLHDPTLNRDQVGHFPALKAVRRCEDGQQLQKGCNEWTIEIHQHADLIVSSTGDFTRRAIVHVLANAIILRAHLARDGYRIPDSIRFSLRSCGICSCTYHDLQITRVAAGGAIIHYHASPVGIGDIMNGLDSRIITIRSIDRTIPVFTISLVICSGNGISDGLPGHILDQQPGRKQEREIDDGEQQHQQDRQSQRELNDALRVVGSLQ